MLTSNTDRPQPEDLPSRRRIQKDKATDRFLLDIDLGDERPQKRRERRDPADDQLFLVADLRPDPKSLIKPKPESVESMLGVIIKAKKEMTVEERLAALQEGVKKPGDNNDDLIKAILQSTNGKPFTGANDPRLLLLARIGYTHQDPRVEQAAAIALLRGNQKDGYFAGLWMLADVAQRGSDQEKAEANKTLDDLAKISIHKDNVDRVRREASCRSDGALFTINDSGDGIAKQERLKDEAAIKEKVKAAEAALADDKLPGRFKVQALADAWMAGDRKDPTKLLLPLTKKLAYESKDDQVKFAAVMLLLCSDNVVDKAEFTKLLEEVKKLKGSSNAQVKAEATQILALAERK